MKKSKFFKKRIFHFGLILVAVFIICTAFVTGMNAATSTEETSTEKTSTENTMRDISPLQAVREMKVGWNLGNTLDAIGGETAWGQPVTTKAMVDEVKAMGFNTLRIPTTYDGHVGAAPDYLIDEAWLDRVEEVANYALSNNMYAIINLHHENNWLITTYAAEAETKAKLTKIWEQIANRFKDYGDHLIFETMNEPRLTGTPYEWTGGTAEARDVINHYNLAAVNAIRESGSNNTKRFIMIPTHAAATLAVCMDDLVIPNNDKQIIVSLHMYSPYSYAMDEKGTAEWGSDQDKAALSTEFDAIYNKFIKNGRAVVIGECGTTNKNNEASRITHAEYYTKQAKLRGISCIWWDNQGTGVGSENFGLFNRAGLSWYYPEIAKAFIKGSEVSLDIDPNTDLPIVTKKYEAVKSTKPVIDGKTELSWDITKKESIKTSTNTDLADFKIMYDENNLYLYINVNDKNNNGSNDYVNVFIDWKNDKSTSINSDDKTYQFKRSGINSKGNVKGAIRNNSTGYIQEVVIPLDNTSINGNKKIGLDISVNTGNATASWSDPLQKQTSKTSNYGDITFGSSCKLAEAISGTPTIDGEMDSIWEKAKIVNTTSTNPASALGKIRTMWDSQYLYVYGEITDSKLSTISANQWEQDSLEIFIDQNFGRTSSYEADDTQYRINCENLVSGSSGIDSSLFKSATKTTTDGYIIEAAIPLTKIQAKENTLLGVDFQLNDDNGTGTRTGQSSWNDTSGTAWQSTSVFGALRLIK